MRPERQVMCDKNFFGGCENPNVDWAMCADCFEKLKIGAGLDKICEEVLALNSFGDKGKIKERIEAAWLKGFNDGFWDRDKYALSDWMSLGPDEPLIGAKK